MVSDGEVKRTEHPSQDDRMPASEFVVKGATWAVRFNGTKISHVYLWMGAAENAEDLLGTLEAIRTGEAAPAYA